MSIGRHRKREKPKISKECKVGLLKYLLHAKKEKYEQKAKTEMDPKKKEEIRQKRKFGKQLFNMKSNIEKIIKPGSNYKRIQNYYYLYQ